MTSSRKGTRASAPIYRIIKEHIRNRIANGELQTGERIPSEAELVELFNTSRMTVNRALRELSGEGLLIRRQGQGSFVAEQQALSALLEVKSIADVIHETGGKYSCTVHHLGEEKASPKLALGMEITPYSPVFHSIIVHMADDIPIQLADRYVLPEVAPKYLKQDFTTITPNQYLLSLAPISSVEHKVEALIPETWIRQLLNINEAEPCLCLQRTTWVNEKIATRSSFYYPGSRFTLSGRFSPMGNGQIQVC